MAPRLALDHLTTADATPWGLAELSAGAGFQGCCLFLESMDVVPRLPRYSLIDDLASRARARDALSDHAVGLDLVYPFTLTARTRAEDFLPALEAAAWLGARAVNLLSYDRDPGRRVDQLGRAADLAASLGMRSVLEFYPPSAVGSLADAVAIVTAVGEGRLAINVDVLHLYRSGGTTGELEAVARNIGFAQVADGPLRPPEDAAYEAANQRALPGRGAFALGAFLKALPPSATLSVEAPDEEAVLAGVTMEQRADRARAALNAVLKEAVCRG